MPASGVADISGQLGEMQLPILARLNEEEKVENEFLPEELFVDSFTFLSPRDLAAVAAVSKTFRLSAYAPFLWRSFDLTGYSFGVHDAFMMHILATSQRFSELTTLSLEGCDAITDQTLEVLTKHCPFLQTIFLTECFRISSDGVLAFISEMKYLRKIELYHSGIPFTIVRRVRDLRPEIDLGYLWVLFCARFGILPNPDPELYPRKTAHEVRVSIVSQSGERADTVSVEPLSESPPSISNVAEREHTPSPVVPFVRALCRYESQFEAGGCWGEVRGRVVYSNLDYERGGNYPDSVIHSCRNHINEDFKQDDYTQCQVCKFLFQNDSCWSDLICRVCYDRELMKDKNNWTLLTDRNIKRLNFGDLTHKTLTLSDQRNLPKSMKLVGSMKFDLDMPEVYERYDLRSDEDYVPVQTFWECNSAHVEDQLEQVRTILKGAKETGNSTRALLCYGENEETLIYADRGVIADGDDGWDFLKVTMNAFHKFYHILLPLLFIMGFSLFFFIIVPKVMEAESGSPSTIFVPQLVSVDTGDIVFLGVTFGFVALILISLFLCWRFRAACEIEHVEIFLRYFLMVDLFILSAGSMAFLSMTVFVFYNIPVDVIGFFLFAVNFGALSIFSLYAAVPTWIHR
eukprot:182481_1